MRVAVFKTSLKENERRVPIYPDHVPRIPEPLRVQLAFERDYGADYGYRDEFFLAQGASVVSRDELFDDCELMLLPKPMPTDFARMRAGQVLFGWPHCVQQHAITQLAIDRRLTVIAWEAMHHWSPANERLMHVFYKNNEIAGYAAVLHCLRLLGMDGHYGPRRKVVILGYGSVSRGAIYALQGRGFNNIHVFTRRFPHLVADQNPDVYYGQYYPGENGVLFASDSEQRERRLIEELADADIVCNGVLQDPNSPLVFVEENQTVRLKRGSLIVDISCDEKMGFAFARPTSFDKPTFEVGNGVTYYSVDHTPSYLWNAASREISKALLPYLQTVSMGAGSWESDATIMRAIEIRDGAVQNPQILAFQRRHAQYPHAVMAPPAE